MSTQPPTSVEVAADSSTPPAARRASVGSESSSTSSNEVVVVDSAKEEEGGHIETAMEVKIEDAPNNDEPPPEETPVVVAEESHILTTIVPKPEVIATPEKPAVTQVTEAADHGITSRVPGDPAKASAFVTRLNKYINSDNRWSSSTF